MNRSLALLLLLAACGQAAPERPPAAETASLDPRSPEAAAALVRRYFSAVEAGRLDEARVLWPSRDPGEFAGLRADVGAPSPPEGACGSIYVQVPVRLSGTADEQRRIINVRRVNDVDGSTAQQRSWHIDSIEPVR